MASLSNAMASPRKGLGILFVGFLAQDSAPSMASHSFSIQHRHPHLKCFAQKCQGHSSGQSRIIVKVSVFGLPDLY